MVNLLFYAQNNRNHFLRLFSDFTAAFRAPISLVLTNYSTFD